MGFFFNHLFYADQEFSTALYIYIMYFVYPGFDK